ncbi:hypothetical protein L3X38_035123 [Prunus dulcis]|uniref:Uncharacterized protein n=1 Tax=Prunus dulcis TaxID=3755 RepID=A0AAD4YYI5_PRUDU|nr:hypothetical protein L3X38_035123 [Prunus dulcis]
MSCFHPRDGSIVAFHHYLHSEEVTRKLEGHDKKVTSLASTNTLNIFVWGAAGWEELRSKLLQIPDGKELRSLSDT